MFNTERNLYRRVIRAFRRIPADIRQELATREFDMDYGTSCLVGTAVKAGLARMQNLATEDVEMYDYEPGKAKQLFGGSQRVWAEIFVGVTDDRLPVIERAFTNALLETIPA